MSANISVTGDNTAVDTLGEGVQKSSLSSTRGANESSEFSGGDITRDVIQKLPCTTTREGNGVVKVLPGEDVRHSRSRLRDVLLGLLGGSLVGGSGRTRTVLLLIGANLSSSLFDDSRVGTTLEQGRGGRASSLGVELGENEVETDEEETESPDDTEVLSE